MQIINNLKVGEKALEYFREICKYYNMDLLKDVTIKQNRLRTHSGYCAYPKHPKHNKDEFCHIVVGIETHFYPKREPFITGTKQIMGLTYGKRGRLKRCNAGFRWVWKPIILKSADENLVGILFHELWHYLAKTKQVKGGNYQTKADKFAVLSIKCFRQWIINLE